MLQTHTFKEDNTFIQLIPFCPTLTTGKYIFSIYVVFSISKWHLFLLDS